MSDFASIYFGKISIGTRKAIVFALLQLILIFLLSVGKLIYLPLVGCLLLLLILVLKNIDLGVYVLPIALATPIIIIPGTKIHFTELVLALIFSSIFLKSCFTKEPYLFYFPQKVALSLIFFSCVFSLFGARYPIVGVFYITKLCVAFIFVFVFIYNWTKKGEMIKNLMFAMILGGLVAAIYGIFQNFVYTGSFLYSPGIRIFGRAGGVYGAFIGIAIINVVTFILFEKNLGKKIVFFLILPILFYAIFLSGTRAWILATAIALSFVIFLKVYRVLGVKKFIALIIILILIFPLTFDLFKASLWEPFSLLFVRPGISWVPASLETFERLPDLSLMARFRIWEFGWKLFLQHPITGVGIGNVRIANPFHPYLIKPQLHVGYIDNHYINILVETGLLGAFAWAWLFVNLVLVMRRVMRLSSTDTQRFIWIGLMGTILLLFVGGIFWCLTTELINMTILAVIFSLVFSFEKILKEKSKDRSQKSKLSEMGTK